MTLRRTIPALALAAHVAGCETPPVTAVETDGAVALDDLGLAPISPSCRPFGDGGTLRAQGSWRVVAYESEEPAAQRDGGVTDLDAPAGSDLDGGAPSPVTRYTAEGERVVDPATGNATVLRVNGAVQVTGSTLRLALGLLRDDRFALTAPGGAYVSTYDGSGVLTEAERRFVAPADMVSFEFCAGDGDLIVARALGGATRRLTLAPDLSATSTSLTLPLRVRALSATLGAPLTAPRTAILWETPGRAALTETLSEAAVMQGDSFARTLVPLAPQVDGATASFAVGHPALYDDVDGDGRFDPARDALRSVSSLALGWRAPGAQFDDASDANRLAPGWQVVAIHVNAQGLASPVPMDRATVVPLECAATEAPAGALPDVLR
ncbi:MAG: hypothetical protein R3A48_04655 [Polyangiales bacterium]